TTISELVGSVLKFQISEVMSEPTQPSDASESEANVPKPNALSEANQEATSEDDLDEFLVEHDLHAKLKLNTRTQLK
ncbi:hypothetical protein A2U01_0015958, partial [Trifolium medium]|nr:hypothetical protein [Trifolium medium]